MIMTNIIVERKQLTYYFTLFTITFLLQIRGENNCSMGGDWEGCLPSGEGRTRAWGAGGGSLLMMCVVNGGGGEGMV